MTLPLQVQDRATFHGPRYSGALASVHDDNENGELWVQAYGVRFTLVGDPPPFPWAGPAVRWGACGCTEATT